MAKKKKNRKYFARIEWVRFCSDFFRYQNFGIKKKVEKSMKMGRFVNLTAKCCYKISNFNPSIAFVR